MKTSISILRQYQIIAGLSSQMLVKAQAQQWDEVVTLGAQYHKAVEQLRTIDPLSNDDRAARRDLLTQILDDDARIRHLAAPELQRLSHLMGAIKHQRTALEAYYTTSNKT
jgi:flagellar protein FliT